MALNKNDLLLLLAEMKSQGVEVQPQIQSLVNSATLPFEVLKFINERRPLEVTEFYDHLRRNYNQKKSALYKNIVKEVEDPKEVLTTLSALLTQIVL